MRTAVSLSIVGLIAVLLLTGCTPGTVETATVSDPDSMLVTQSEATARGGWTVTPDSGPVDGDTTDCTGASFPWPKSTLEGHASQFLDKAADDSIAVIVKKLDSAGKADVEALRESLAPCAPQSGTLTHGAMITPVGDDSFAYQTQGTDKTGDYILHDMLVACGMFELEAIRISYSKIPDQAGLESVLSPAISRLLTAGGCSS